MLEAFYDLHLAVQKIKDNTVKLTWPFPEGDSLTKGFTVDMFIRELLKLSHSYLQFIAIWKCCCLSVI